MNFELFNQLLKSRKTILRILSDRGYVITQYEKFGIQEIKAMVTASKTNMDALRMDVEKPTGEKCRVLYSAKTIKSSLTGFISKLLNKEDNDDFVDPKTTEVILMLFDENVADVFHAAVYDQWTKHKFRIAFFRIANLVNHPSDHVLVPRHEKLQKDDTTFTPTERVKLPLIRYHEDMQARVLGLVPGDIVRINRSSPSSGEYTLYRICSP